jgi:PAS domain S-box-containing protein
MQPLDMPRQGSDVVSVAQAPAILVADAHGEAAARLKAWLVQEPALATHVAIVRTAAELLLHLQGDPPACLLLADPLGETPAADLLTQVPRLSPLDALPSWPVVVLADDPDPADAEMLRQQGAEVCLARDDLSPATLRLAVRGARDRHGLRVQLARQQARLDALATPEPADSPDASAAPEALARTRLDLLAEAGRRLAESLDPAATLAAVTGLLVPALADLCIVDLFRADGVLERAAVVHADSSKESLVVGLRAYPPDLSRPGVADALRTGRSEREWHVTDAMLVQIARDAHHLALMRALGIVSHMRVPLVARGRVLGSLLLVSTSPARRYGPSEQVTAEELIGRCALALDNARLHAAEERARQRATALADATRALTEVGAMPAAVLPLVAHQAATLVGDLAVVRLLSDDGRWLEPAAVDHPNPAARNEARAALDGERHGADQGANGAALRTGSPQRLAGESLAALRAASVSQLWAPMQHITTDALLAVPLIVEGRGIGTLSISRSGPDPAYDEDDERFLQELGDRAALAIERARLFADLRANATRLRRQLDLTRTITENATLALFMVDEQLNCTYLNSAAERLTGFTMDELRGRTLHESIHYLRPDGSPYPQADCPIDRALREQRQVHGEETFVHRGGSLYPVAFTVSPILHDGAHGGAIMEVRDTTAEKLVEAERAALLAQEQAARADAEAAVRARDQFLSIAAHELRTPTAGIKGHAQLALRLFNRGEIDPERLVRGLRGIEISADRLTWLIDDLLDVARLQRGQLRLHVQPLDLAALIEAAVQRHRERDPDATRLELVRPADPISIVGDAGRLEQVIDNLLSNALKYSPGGGQVRATVSVDGNLVTLTVEDGGIGLPPGAADRIFEPFGRAANAMTQNVPGMGLGLYISRQIVEAHGGRIAAASDGEGQGATFTIWLPPAPGAAEDGALRLLPVTSDETQRTPV